MTKAQRHKAEASRCAREADRLRGMAAAAEISGYVESAALLRTSADRRAAAAENHRQAFVNEVSLALFERELLA